MNPELQKYVSEARQRGMGDEQIHAELLQAGWSEENINQVIPPQVPPSPTLQQNAVPAPTQAWTSPENISENQQTVSKRGWILVGIILFMVAGATGASAYFFFFSDKNEIATLPRTEDSTAPQSNQINKTCSDLQCFVSAIGLCTNTIYKTESEAEFLGSNIKANINFELSQSDNKCLLHISPLTYNISPTKDFLDSMQGGEMIGPGPDEIYPQLNKEAQEKIIGKTGACNITNDKEAIADLFNDNSELVLLLDPDYSICSGELFAQ